MPKIRLLLDSGIYSAWSRGQPLDMSAYIEYVQRNRDWVHAIVSFDDIPPMRPSKEQAAEAAGQSYLNHLEMKQAGLAPIPVYHQCEHIVWLQRMIDAGETYIGISSAKYLWTREQREWLDRVFDRLSKYPHVRTHGFGITNSAFLLRYPFTTVDSTTWALSAGNGSIYVPPRGDYSQPAKRIVVSRRHQQGTLRRHYEFLDEEMRESVRTFLESAGRDDDDRSYEYSDLVRKKLILFYYRQLLAHIAKTRAPPTIFYSTNPQATDAEVLEHCGATTHLLSYFMLRDKPDWFLRSYVRTGIVSRKPVPRPLIDTRHFDRYKDAAWRKWMGWRRRLRLRRMLLD